MLFAYEPYELYLILDHDLMLVLKLLCEELSFFIIQIVHMLVALINLHSSWQEW